MASAALHVVDENERVPWDLAAEEAVVAAVLVDATYAIPEVSGVVSGSEFFREKHGWIFDAAMAIWDRSEQPNQITVAHELAVRGQLSDAGGQTFLAEIIRRLPTAMGCRWYAEIVARTAKRRKLISLASKIQLLAETEDDPERIADLALDQLVRAGVKREKALTRTLSEELRDGVQDQLVALMTERGRAQPVGFTTGWADLDRLIDGLVPGNLITLLADVGMGKSFLLANIARNVALAGKRVQLVTTEVTRAETAQRVVWLDAAMDPISRRFGRGFSESDIARVMESLGRVDDWGSRVWVTDAPGIALEALRGEVKREQMRHGLDVLFVDHMGHVRVRNQPDPRLRVEVVCRALKELAVTESIPVVQVAHVNRAAQQAGSGRISYNDGKDSSAIEQESDRVLAMFAVDDMGEPLPREAAMAWKQAHGYQLMRLEAGKNRSGPTAGITMRLHWSEGGRFLPTGGE
jgi:replicative DNA helicase